MFALAWIPQLHPMLFATLTGKYAHTYNLVICADDAEDSRGAPLRSSQIDRVATIILL
jgi:hypothetical protein